jgi:putative spermidine/putrescine transport system permease protein
MIIMIGGRQGLVALGFESLIGQRVVFAYTLVGLFLGYLYFSIPRTLLTIMAAVEKLDVHLDEAARSLGAAPLRVLIDVTLPALKPALVTGAALCFATSMGAIGTVLSLGTRISVLPLTIYSEFILLSNIAVAAALSFVLAAITFVVLAVSRAAAGSTVAAAG